MRHRAISLLALGLATFISFASRAEAQTAPPADLRVSTAWLAQHLSDPTVRIVATGSRAEFNKAHIPGARFVEHDDTLDMTGGRHQIKPPPALVPVLTAAGITDGARVVLYGDSPMTTGWLYTVIASTGHEADISWLDGSLALWEAEGRPTSTTAAPPVTGQLTVKAPSAHAVDAKWVRDHLTDTNVAILDVRTTQEWNAGHLPGATLILWQDLFEDQRTLKFKSPEQIRALLASKGVAPTDEVVTYCAVGMRASLMYWAARSVGLPARVYVGSWQDWQRDASNPVSK
jgi:thiosulfate/3-mercaptopyruvate sulfurtransferase